MLQPGARAKGGREGEVETSLAIQNNPSPLLPTSPAAIPRFAWHFLSTRQDFPIATVLPSQRCALILGAVTAGCRSWQLSFLFTALLSSKKQNQCQSEQVLLMVLETRRIRKQQLQG